MSFMLDISWREDFLMMKCVCAGVAVAGEPDRCVLGTFSFAYIKGLNLMKKEL